MRKLFKHKKDTCQMVQCTCTQSEQYVCCCYVYLERLSMSICVISGHWSELERQDVHFSFHSLVVTAKYDVLYAYIMIGPLTSVSIFFEVKK